MSVRKTSDLPGLGLDSAEYELDKYKDSLFEISYLSAGNKFDARRFKSMYVQGEDMAKMALSAGGIYETLSAISSELSTTIYELSNSLSDVCTVTLRKWTGESK